MPGILFLPFFTYAAQMASMAFFSFFILLINTCGSFTASDLEEAAHASLTTELCGCDVSNETRIGLRIGGIVVGGQIRFAAFNKRQVVFRRSECRRGSMHGRCQHGADGRGVMRGAAAP